jgi:hypothetical protein
VESFWSQIEKSRRHKTRGGLHVQISLKKYKRGAISATCVCAHVCTIEPIFYDITPMRYVGKDILCDVRLSTESRRTEANTTLPRKCKYVR